MVVFPADVGIKEIGSAEVVPMEILILDLTLSWAGMATRDSDAVSPLTALRFPLASRKKT